MASAYPHVPAKPKVSIIIVNWNGLPYLPECLSSVFSDKKIAFEVILVDNASTDGSVEWVEMNYPQVRVMKNKENTGFAAANNIGAKNANGGYLCFLNYDTVVEKEWLSALVETIENEKQAGAVTAKLLLHQKPRTINTIGGFFSVFGIAGSFGDGEDAGKYAERRTVFSPSGAAFLIRKELFDKLGGFDQKFFMYQEDVDLGWGVWNSGYDVVFQPKSVVYHKYENKRNPGKMFFISRNLIWTIWKNASTVHMLFLLPISMASSFAIAASFLAAMKPAFAIEVMRGTFAGFTGKPKRRGLPDNGWKRMLGPFATARVFLQKFRKHFLQ
ncbi:MAG: glycosyltransferase family 2 protein [Candidatus Micrarchaeia archaeon]